MESIRVCRIPPCLMVSSGRGMFGDGVLEAFMEWCSTLPESIHPQDYLWFDGEGFVWYYVYQPGMQVPDTFNVVHFEGGLYAVATGKDADEGSYNHVQLAFEQFFKNNERFVRDDTRVELGNIITPEEAEKALGYQQMDYYVPVRILEDE